MIDDVPVRDPAVPVRLGPVRRAVPQLGRRWGPVLGEISGLLLDVRDLGFRDAVQAWGRLSAAIRSAAPYSGLGFLTVDADDVDVLGRAARALGASLLPGGHPDVASTLCRAAEAVGCDPDELLVQLARVHGVLDLDLGADGEMLRLWGADGPVFVTPPGEALVAHRRTAARIYRMWHGGDGDRR